MDGGQPPHADADRHTAPGQAQQVLAAFAALDSLLKAEPNDPWQQPPGASQDLGRSRSLSDGGGVLAQSGSSPRGGDTAAEPSPTLTQGRKRGPKRTIPNMDDLEAQLAAKQQEVLQLERRNMHLKRRKRLLETVIACRDQQLARLEAQHMQGGSEGVHGAHALIKRANVSLPHQPVSWREYSQMPVEHMLDNWRCLLAAVSDSLLGLDPSTSPPAVMQASEQRLDFLTTALLYIFQNLILNNPAVVQVAAFSVHGHQQQAPEQHWAQVASVLNLRPEQAEDAAILYGLYRRWVDAVLQERQRLMDDYNTRTSQDAGSLGMMASDAGGHAELQHVDRLQQSVQRELCVIVLVAEVFLATVLSRVQFAKAVVSSHPQMLDSISLLAACAQLYSDSGPAGQPGG